MLGAALYLGIIVAVAGRSWLDHACSSWLATPADIIAQSDAYARVIFLTMPVFFRLLRLRDDFARHRRFHDAVLCVDRLEPCSRSSITPLFIVGAFGLPKLGVVSAAVAGLIANTRGARVAALLSRAAATIR